jgi:hypothetical protein
MRGRKPKPSHLKLLDGNPGRRRLNPDEPEPLSGRQRAPLTFAQPLRQSGKG